MNNSFLEKVGDVLSNAKHNIKTAVNLSMVYTYYEIGKIIVKKNKTEMSVPNTVSIFLKTSRNI